MPKSEDQTMTPQEAKAVSEIVELMYGLDPAKRYKVYRVLVYEGDGEWLRNTLDKSLPHLGKRDCGNNNHILAFTSTCNQVTDAQETT